MKNLFFISVLFTFFIVTSISLKAQQYHQPVSKSAGVSVNRPIKFIEGIEINRSIIPDNNGNFEANTVKTITSNNTFSAGIEKSLSIQFKYAQLLNKDVELIRNIPLFNFVDEWWETRYRYGGSTKKGIDCSAFSGLLLNTVYGIDLPRTAREQYDACSKISIGEMEEGDMVFFNTRGGVSHVGVYLGDGFFVHASTSNGVTISSLDEPYYHSRFLGGGRIMNQEVIANNLANGCLP